jgi:uncharacterized alpha/beta hydrolase family protein
MEREFFTNHIQVVFLGALLLTVLVGVTFPRKNRQKEKPDPPVIFGSIRGMYVCYQCDTIFNTAQCPRCYEEAMIPLIHLTGSVMQNESLTAMISRLQEHRTLKVPLLQDSDADTPAPASRREPVNGDASEVPFH